MDSIYIMFLVFMMAEVTSLLLQSFILHTVTSLFSLFSSALLIYQLKNSYDCVWPGMSNKLWILIEKTQKKNHLTSLQKKKQCTVWILKEDVMCVWRPESSSSSWASAAAQGSRPAPGGRTVQSIPDSNSHPSSWHWASTGEWSAADFEIFLVNRRFQPQSRTVRSFSGAFTAHKHN